MKRSTKSCLRTTTGQSQQQQQQQQQPQKPRHSDAWDSERQSNREAKRNIYIYSP